MDKVQVRAFPVRKAQGLQVRAAIHTGVPPQTLALREAIAQNPALLSLRDRLMEGDVPEQGVAKRCRKGRRSRTLWREKRSQRDGVAAVCRCPRQS